jgi:hypothetical protein
MASPRRILLAAATALCAVILTGCGSSSPSGPVISPGTGALGEGGDTATPAAPTGGPTDIAVPLTFPASAEAYTKAALQAWVAKNTTALNQYEVAGGQLHTLASCDGCYNTAFTFVECQGAAGSSYCLFVNAVGDQLTLKVVNEQLGKPLAMGLGSLWDPTTFPSDNRAYAQLALTAWQEGNDARLKLLTKQSLRSADIDAKGAQRSGSWTYGGTDGAAGSLYYRFTSGGHQLAFQFTNGPAAPTTGPDSQHRIGQVIYTA